MGKGSAVAVLNRINNRTSEMGLPPARFTTENQTSTIGSFSKVLSKLKTESVSLAVKALHLKVTESVIPQCWRQWNGKIRPNIDLLQLLALCLQFGPLAAAVSGQPQPAPKLLWQHKRMEAVSLGENFTTVGTLWRSSAEIAADAVFNHPRTRRILLLPVLFVRIDSRGRKPAALY